VWVGLNVTHWIHAAAVAEQVECVLQKSREEGEGGDGGDNEVRVQEGCVATCVGVVLSRQERNRGCSTNKHNLSVL
jgi:hypothetical protein